MLPTYAHIDQITERIIGCAIEVHKTFGAGLLESVYRECMIVEMKNAGLRFESERCINLAYKGVPINSKLRVDLLVEGIVVVELKAIECLHPIVTRMKAGVKRLDHPDLYTQKKNESSS